VRRRAVADLLKDDAILEVLVAGRVVADGPGHRALAADDGGGARLGVGHSAGDCVVVHAARGERQASEVTVRRAKSRNLAVVDPQAEASADILAVALSSDGRDLRAKRNRVPDAPSP
jgi:hypothetical protein